MVSPITGKNNVKERKLIPTWKIIQTYRERLKMDVSKYFFNDEFITIYECIDSGLLYYYPRNITGDKSFYNELEKFPWYYMENKWEYDKAISEISPADRVLDFGCGNGKFLNYLSNLNISAEGYDPSISDHNEPFVIHNNPLEYFVKLKENYFDTICAFQVFEHIEEVNKHLKLLLKCLKPGGKLIISVPNNNAFIKNDEYDVLNMPPHHINLWNQISLNFLSSKFNLEIKSTYKEPLQVYHNRWYLKTQIKRYFPEIFFKVMLKFKLYKTLEKLLPPFSRFITGHTIMAVYQK